jgi:hypothetical protein
MRERRFGSRRRKPGYDANLCFVMPAKAGHPVTVHLRYYGANATRIWSGREPASPNLAGMRYKPATYALLRLRADLIRKSENSRQQRPSLRVDIWHVEAVIRLLEPGAKIRQLERRKPNPWFKHGTLFRLTVEALKAAGRPLSSQEITLALLRQRGVTDADPLAVADLLKSVERSLVYHRDGSIEAVGSRPVHWKLAD